MIRFVTMFSRALAVVLVLFAVPLSIILAPRFMNPPWEEERIALTSRLERAQQQWAVALAVERKRLQFDQQIEDLATSMDSHHELFLKSERSETDPERYTESIRAWIDDRLTVGSGQPWDVVFRRLETPEVIVPSPGAAADCELSDGACTSRLELVEVSLTGSGLSPSELELLLERVKPDDPNWKGATLRTAGITSEPNGIRVDLALIFRMSYPRQPSSPVTEI